MSAAAQPDTAAPDSMATARVLSRMRAAGFRLSLDDGRLPASQRIALDALKTALVEHGAEDRGVVSVAEDQWRKAAYDGGISDGDSDAKKKAFKRARLDLVAKGRVKTHESRYWIPQIWQGGQKGTKGDMSLYVPDSGGGTKGDTPL